MTIQSIPHKGATAMRFPVIVRIESEHRYVAQPMGIPEIEVTAPTEAEALAEVASALEHWWVTAKVVQVAIPAAENGNPWLDSFGRSADDPDFDEFAAELQRLRTLEALE